MQAPPASGAGASLQTMAALRLLRALFSAPGNPFVSDWALVDFYAQYHFLHFARLFHDLPGGGPPLTALCEAHLQVDFLHRIWPPVQQSQGCPSSHSQARM